MSKLSFRARALDASKPLPIFHARDVPDLSDYQAINRTVPQMPTGMEKEEETERHLQEVILAQQTNCHHDVYIPTPEVAVNVAHYEHIYQKVLHRQSPYIRVPGLGLEEEVPDYDLDSEDEEWLNAQTKERPLSPLHFERMMDKLERGSGNTVLSERDAQSLLKDEEDLVIAVYDYWLAKRLRLGRALIPAVKHERRDGTSSNNPYLAFRKRTEKMQTRKNRKNDETAYMQMLKLKRDLSKAKNLAEYILERESKKHQLAKVEADIFRQRYQLEDWSGSIMSSLRPVSTQSDTSARHSSSVGDGWDHNSRPGFIKIEPDDQVQVIGRQPVLLSSGLKRKSKKKKFPFPPGTPEPESIVPSTPIKDVSQTTTVEKSDDEEIDGIFTFRRKPHVRYHKVLDVDDIDWDMCNGVPLCRPEQRKRYRYSCTSFGGSSGFVGKARRRVGRGGRVMWDCVESSESEFEDEKNEGLNSSPAVGVDNKENQHIQSRLKRCRFVSRSPSPTSNFEFQTFPLIEHPDPSLPPSDPGTSMAIFEFGGFTSDSEFPEDASSFSTLPTSQFALKPSSSDIESSSQDEKMDFSPPSSSSAVSHSLMDHSASGGRPQTGLHDLRTVLTSKTALFDDRSKKDGPSTDGAVLKSNLSSPQFTNSLTLKPPPSEHVRRQQQPLTTPTNHQNPPQPSPTIKSPVLIPQPPTSYTFSNTTHNVTTSLHNKLQSTSSSTTETSKTTSVNTTTSCAPLSTPQHTDPQRTPLNRDTSRDPSNTSTTLVDPRTAVRHDNNVQQSHNVAAITKPGQHQHESASTPQSIVGGANNTGISNDASSDTLSNSKSDQVTPSSTQNGPTTTSTTSSVQNNNNTTAASRSKSSSDTGTYTPPPPPISPPAPVAQTKQQTSWLMDGPSSTILSLSSTSNKTNSSKKSTLLLSSSGGVGSEKKELSLSMTEAASAITSQFLQHSRDEMNSVGPGAGGQVVGRGNEQSGAVSLQTARALPLSLSRELHLPIIQGTIPMTTSRLPTSLPPAQITTKLEGAHPSQQQMFDKRSISAQNLVARRASVTTNGTSYPEIFHTARRFSETTERGLKQALSGINHNSLLDTATNSLVQPRAPKPSEVT